MTINMEQMTPRQFTMAIVEGVAARHGVEPDDIFGPHRFKKIVKARHEAIAEIVEARPHWSYPTVGRLFNRDHTTVLHVLWKLGKWSPRGASYGKHQIGMPAAAAIGTFIRSLTIITDGGFESWASSEL